MRLYVHIIKSIVLQQVKAMFRDKSVGIHVGFEPQPKYQSM